MFIFDVFFQLIRFFVNSYARFSGHNMHKSKTQIFVKCGKDATIPIHLENDWTISDLKKQICSQLFLRSDEIRIVFAGKELHDDVQLKDCDVGEQSIVHAIKSKKEKFTVDVEAKCPLNKTPFCSSDYDDNNLKPNVKKSHFFVFCSYPCKTLCCGKLRVRCGTCKEGTLTVNRDPSCWDDVLLPSQISGSCLSENCNGSVAEFYFKCSEHVSTSPHEVVPLHLVKNNFKNVPCIACTDINNIIIVFPCTDGHVICLECFQLFCNSRLNERRFIQDPVIGYSLDCPAGCPDSLIKEPHHFKLLEEDQYARYQRFGAEECLLQAGGVMCPRPGCGAGLLPDKDCRKIVCSTLGGAGCGFVFCRHCMQGFHIGPCDLQEETENDITFPHSIDNERALNSKWDEESTRTIKVTTKPCPKCRIPTERDGGCMHMVCTRPQCNFHWCWICQEQWSRDCQGSHWFG